MIEQEILDKLNKKENYFVIGAAGSGKNFFVKYLMMRSHIKV